MPDTERSQGELHHLTRIQLPPGVPTDEQIAWFYAAIVAAYDRQQADWRRRHPEPGPAPADAP
jgi:hypothetical protein